MIEKTLVVLKPDCVARGITGEILSRFEKVGLKIVAMKMIFAKKEQLEKVEKIGPKKAQNIKKVVESEYEF